MAAIHLEICAFSLVSCIVAEKAGADRIELCTGPSDGGTTPPYSLIKEVVRQISIPVVPIVRPRGGNFNYSSSEFDMMMEDIRVAKELGCFGVALSVLKDDNTVDVERIKALVQLASPLQVTFIRGFDLTPDPFKALEDIVVAGCHRILTSGQKHKAEQSTKLIRELVIKAGDRISIMPGSGINEINIDHIASETGAREFHASARIHITDEKLIGFGFGSALSCNEMAIQQMRATLNRISIAPKI